MTANTTDKQAALDAAETVQTLNEGAVVSLPRVTQPLIITSIAPYGDADAGFLRVRRRDDPEPGLSVLLVSGYDGALRFHDGDVARGPVHGFAVVERADD